MQGGSAGESSGEKGSGKDNCLLLLLDVTRTIHLLIVVTLKIVKKMYL